MPHFVPSLTHVLLNHLALNMYTPHQCTTWGRMGIMLIRSHCHQLEKQIPKGVAHFFTNLYCFLCQGPLMVVHRYPSVFGLSPFREKGFGWITMQSS